MRTRLALLGLYRQLFRNSCDLNIIVFGDGVGHDEGFKQTGVDIRRVPVDCVWCVEDSFESAIYRKMKDFEMK